MRVGARSLTMREVVLVKGEGGLQHAEVPMDLAPLGDERIHKWCKTSGANVQRDPVYKCTRRRTFRGIRPQY